MHPPPPAAPPPAGPWAPAPRAARRRRRWVPWAVGLAVLLGLLVGADRVAAVVAENRAATMFRDAEGLSSTPSVTVHGFPFLTQLASRNFGEISVGVSDLAIQPDGRQLRFQHVQVDLHHVHVGSDFHSATARSADGTARVGYDDLSRALGVPIRYADHGRIATTASVTISGVTVRGSVSARVEGDTQSGLSFLDPQVTLQGTSVPGAGLALSHVFGAPISFGSLPFGLVVGDIVASSSGLSVHFSTADLSYG